MAYLLLVNDSWEGWCAHHPFISDKNTFTNAKQDLLSGEGLGRKVIGNYCNGSLSENSIRDAIAAMKKSDIMATLVARVQQQIEAAALAKVRKALGARNIRELSDILPSDQSSDLENIP